MTGEQKGQYHTGGTSRSGGLTQLQYSGPTSEVIAKHACAAAVCWQHALRAGCLGCLSVILQETVRPLPAVVGARATIAAHQRAALVAVGAPVVMLHCKQMHIRRCVRLLFGFFGPSGTQSGCHSLLLAAQCLSNTPFGMLCISMPCACSNPAKTAASLCFPCRGPQTIWDQLSAHHTRCTVQL